MPSKKAKLFQIVFQLDLFLLFFFSKYFFAYFELAEIFILETHIYVIGLIDQSV